MDRLFNELCKKYNCVYSDMTIGYPINTIDISEMWNTIHKLQIINRSNDASLIFKILKEYEA